MYWWENMGMDALRMAWKAFWKAQMECGHPLWKANLTSTKSHTSVSKCTLLLWNPPLSPATSQSVFLSIPPFFTLRHFSLNTRLLCEDTSVKCYWQHITTAKTVRVGAKIHILPSPVTVMNSSIARSFFSLCLPSKQQILQLKPQLRLTVVVQL